MRVIVVLSSLLPGGAERVSLEIAHHLSRAGNEVHLLVARVSKNCPIVYKVPETVHVHYLRHGGENKFIRTIGNAILLKKLVSSIAPDWVISLGAQYKLLLSTGIFDSCKVLLSERNYPPAFYSPDSLKLVKKCYRKADRVVFQTKEASDCFPDLLSSQIKIIPNAARASSMSWQGSDSKHIAFVGRLTSQKNPKMLIEAFALFHNSHNEYVLDVFGEGELKSEIMALVQFHRLGKAVVLHGHSNTVQQDISSSLMYISTSDYEGISNSMLEAMSMGMPCVCTDCAGGGAHLAIENGENGLLVPCGDVSAMAKAMSRIAESPELADKLGHAAALSMEKFAPDVIYGQWMDALGQK